MATLTTRLQATKPASTENVNVTVLNNNFDLFDQAAGSSVGVSASRPASAFQGRMWYSTNTSLLQVNTAASASAAASWATITSPPVTPTDTGWVNLTPISGTGTFQYRVYDRTVFFRLALSSVTSIAAGTTATLLNVGGFPAAYRPSIDMWVAGNSAGTLLGFGKVLSDGSVTYLNCHTAAVTTARFMTSWFKE